MFIIKQRRTIMNQQIINIPSGTNYLSDVMDDLPHNAYINKGVTGCGGTTLALTNDKPYIVAAHSKTMVLNKTSQLQNVLGVTGDTKDQEIKDYLLRGVVKKIIVTYDSLPRLMEFINPQDFHLLVDEVQVLIRYAGVFKIKVCNELLKRTINFKTVSYLTATPTPIQYLPDSIKDLDYVEYQWEDAVKPIVHHKYVGNQISTKVLSYILDKYFNTDDDIFVFFNTVNGVATTINKLLKSEPSITVNDINIFFAESNDNTKVFTKHLGSKFSYSVPLKGNEKRINFVSSLGFEGIDFYNKSVSILVVSDSKYRSMRYDVSIDIPQIIGRFRNVPCTPIDFIWSVYTDEAKMTEEEFIAKFRNDEREVKEMVDFTGHNTVAAKSAIAYIEKTNTAHMYNDGNTVFVNEYAYSSLMSSFSAMHCDYYVLNKNKEIKIEEIEMIQKASDIFSLDDTFEIAELSPKHAKNLDRVYSFTKLAKEYCQYHAALEEDLDIDNIKMYRDKINELLTYSDQLKKYDGVLKPSNITSAAYSMKKLDDLYDEIVMIKSMVSNPLKLELKKTYPLYYIKELTEKLYADTGISKKYKLPDLINWYEFSNSNLKINGEIVRSIKITGIKDI